MRRSVVRPRWVAVLLTLLFGVGAHGMSLEPTQPELPIPGSLNNADLNSTSVSYTHTNIETSLLADFKYLSSIETAGRKPETTGHKKAQEYLSKRFSEIGLLPFQTKYQHAFSKKMLLDHKHGVNLIGLLQGQGDAHQYVVVTAHYDHLGSHRGKVHLGADDNASGVAGLLALAQFLSQQQRHFSYVFVATDLEENGLYGSLEFVNNPPVPLHQIRLNINLDMLSQGGRKHRLYLSGSRQVAEVKPIVLEARTRFNESKFNLKLGHDNRKFRTHSGSKNVDWKKASDHYAFATKRIPYLYFGVDTHRDYHKPTDTFENADKAFFSRAVSSIIFITHQLDQDPMYNTHSFGEH